jgi:hypothetical protein
MFVIMRESCKNVEYLTNSNPYNFITFSYNILEAAKFRTYEEAKNCEDQVFDMLYWQGKNTWIAVYEKEVRTLHNSLLGQNELRQAA